MRLLALFPALLLLCLVTGRTAAGRETQLYTCGMHPQIIQDYPGNCPICGMKLVPLHLEGDWNASTIKIDPETLQRMNLKFAAVTQGPVDREIRAVGSVAYADSGQRDITLKYDGWIEQLYVDATATAVQAGEPLFRIYSPDLYNAELNFLVAWRSEGATGGPLSRAARTRLELYDLPDEYINRLARTGHAERTYTYRAPAAGIVTDKPVVVGRLVRAGEPVYRLASLDPIWVVAQVYESDAPYVHPGQPVTIRSTFGPPRDYAGTVSLLEPQLDDATRTLMARIVLANPDGPLRPGMYVDVRFAARVADDAVLVPADAVLRTGEHNTVFVAQPGGRFEPREIVLGARDDHDRYQVLRGLTAGEQVVISGQFMLDSESQLRAGIQKMLARRLPAPVVPPPTASLIALAFAGADAAAALGNDDLAAWRETLPKLNQALAAYLATLPPGAGSPLARFSPLPDRDSLAAVRQDFEPFSTALVDVVRAGPPAGPDRLHTFECPMSPVLGTARWLQRTAAKRNPFYGSAMPDCGDELP
ncbi:MAG: efflux RND transporter periplasmic adaptor subunit [Opitutales bacterium]